MSRKFEIINETNFYFKSLSNKIKVAAKVRQLKRENKKGCNKRELRECQLKKIIFLFTINK